MALIGPRIGTAAKLAGKEAEGILAFSRSSQILSAAADAGRKTGVQRAATRLLEKSGEAGAAVRKKLTPEQARIATKTASALKILGDSPQAIGASLGNPSSAGRKVGTMIGSSVIRKVTPKFSLTALDDIIKGGLRKAKSTKVLRAPKPSTPIAKKPIIKKPVQISPIVKDGRRVRIQGPKPKPTIKQQAPSSIQALALGAIGATAAVGTAATTYYVGQQRGQETALAQITREAELYEQAQSDLLEEIVEAPVVETEQFVYPGGYEPTQQEIPMEIPYTGYVGEYLPEGILPGVASYQVGTTTEGRAIQVIDDEIETMEDDEGFDIGLEASDIEDETEDEEQEDEDIDIEE